VKKNRKIKRGIIFEIVLCVISTGFVLALRIGQ